MENLVRILTMENTNFCHDSFLKFLMPQEYKMFTFGTEDEKRVKRTFLTYNGLLKVIFRSNSGIGYRFRKWATKVVYTAHLGTDEQRFEQALDIAGVNATLVKQVFDTCVPCVYLFCIGRVSNMRKYYPELKEFRTGMTKSLHRKVDRTYKRLW